MNPHDDQDPHRWTRARVAAWHAGLLSETDAERFARHLEECAACRDVTDAWAHADEDPGTHLSPAVIAAWPRARRSLRGLERALVRRHLERCSECRQDLEMLGHPGALEWAPELESTELPSGAPARAPGPATESGSGALPRRQVIRIVQAAPRWRERALIAWSAVATAAAAIAIVGYLRRPVVEGDPQGAAIAPSSSRAIASAASGISVRFAPRPRSLKAPARGIQGGRMNVIPVMGPVHSLTLSVHPLDIPDTSLVMVSLLDAEGDTLFTMRHRQWEFFPKRVLMIEGGDAPLMPGQYALVLASLITKRGDLIPLMNRYRFELRPRR